MLQSITFSISAISTLQAFILIEFFEQRKVYGIPVRQSIHPKLNEYILELLKVVKPDLLQKRISRLYITIINQESRPVEKYCFQIKSMAQDLGDQQPCTIDDIQAYLRTFLLKISCLDSILSPITSTLF